MVYHLKNTDFIREVMRAVPWAKKDVIEELAKTGTVRTGRGMKDVEEIIETLIMPCVTKTTTDMGTEICLNQVREDIIGSGGGVAPPAFEELLRALDESLIWVKTDFYEKHIL